MTNILLIKEKNFQLKLGYHPPAVRRVGGVIVEGRAFEELPLVRPVEVGDIEFRGWNLKSGNPLTKAASADLTTPSAYANSGSRGPRPSRASVVNRNWLMSHPGGSGRQ